jgi:hypothetical protein
MSLRPEICGFDLAQMQALFGSGRQEAVAAVQGEFDRQVAKYPGSFDQSFQTTFRQALAKAIHQGVPFPELELEKEPHVQLAVLLAQHNQQLLGTDSNDWKWTGFSDFWDQRGGGPLFEFLLFGRPLFGNRIDTHGVYGYLSRAEVQQLRSSLSELGRDEDDLDDQEEHWAGLSEDVKAQLNQMIGLETGDELLTELCRWCDEIVVAKKDLFIWWQ